MPLIRVQPSARSNFCHLLLSFVYAFILCQREISACPKSCTCGKDEVVVICQRGSFADIAPGLTMRLETLVLEDVSGIETIKATLLLKHSDRLKSLTINKGSVKAVEPFAFVGFLVLKELDLKENELSGLDPDSFTGLGNLKSLNLAGNKLSVVEDALDPLIGLQTLNLSHNSLKEISPSVFRNQSSLTSLTLNNNPLKTLNSKSLSGLSSLQTLRMRDCSLQSLHMDVFYSTPSLRYLDLGQNRLSKPLSRAVIADLTFLNTLLFDHNELDRLADKEFALLHLDRLDLSYNRINYIERTAFQNLTVKELDLSYNLILSLETDFLKPLSSGITSLNLARNPVEKIKVDTFSDFRLLEKLNLSSCSLDALHHQTLSSLPALTMLDMSHNNLHVLSGEFLKLLDKMTEIHMSKNAWVCDCHIKPLLAWLGKPGTATKLRCPQSPGKPTDCITLQCAAPSQLYQKLLTQLEDEQLGRCPEKENSSDLPASTQGAIVAACLGFAVIFLIITIYLWRKGKTRFKLKRVCLPSNAESSHMIDEDSKVPPLSNCERASLNESDHEFVVRHYFDTLVTDPKLMSRTSDSEEPTSPKERDSMYSSQPSLYSPMVAPMGIESTV